MAQAAGVDSSPTIGHKIRPNGSFPHLRVRTYDCGNSLSQTSTFKFEPSTRRPIGTLRAMYQLVPASIESNDREKQPPKRGTFVSRSKILKRYWHGKIFPIRHGSWGEYSESMVGGYVRLQAEACWMYRAIGLEPSAERKPQTVGKPPLRPIAIYDRCTYARDPAHFPNGSTCVMAKCDTTTATTNAAI